MVKGLVRLIVCALLLTACSTRPTVPPVFDMPAQDPLRESPAEWLWQSGVNARDHNDLAAAGRYFERALEVVPDSSWLYRELAELRLRQGDPRAAEGLARKALRHAPADPAYQAALWQLIAMTRQRQGDAAGAEQARNEAELLRRRQ